MIVDISNEIKKIKSLKDLIRLLEKYDKVMIDKNLLIRDSSNHCMYIIYSGNKY